MPPLLLLQESDFPYDHHSGPSRAVSRGAALREAGPTCTSLAHHANSTCPQVLGAEHLGSSPAADLIEDSNQTTYLSAWPPFSMSFHVKCAMFPANSAMG